MHTAYALIFMRDIKSLITAVCELGLLGLGDMLNKNNIQYINNKLKISIQQPVSVITQKRTQKFMTEISNIFECFKKTYM